MLSYNDSNFPCLVPSITSVAPASGSHTARESDGGVREGLLLEEHEEVGHHHHHHHHTSTSRSTFSNLELTRDHGLREHML